MWVVKKIRKNTYRKYYRPGNEELATWVILCLIVLSLVLLFGRAILAG